MLDAVCASYKIRRVKKQTNKTTALHKVEQQRTTGGVDVFVNVSITFHCEFSGKGILKIQGI